LQNRHFKLTNFRGISTLSWSPAGSVCCLIGVGNSGKSTVLDAIAAALSSRWLSVSSSFRSRGFSTWLEDSRLAKGGRRKAGWQTLGAQERQASP
jgi:predicted ATP-dependent endonuclease of OLD family